MPRPDPEVAQREAQLYRGLGAALVESTALVTTGQGCSQTELITRAGCALALVALSWELEDAGLMLIEGRDRAYRLENSLPGHPEGVWIEWCPREGETEGFADEYPDAATAFEMARSDALRTDPVYLKSPDGTYFRQQREGHVRVLGTRGPTTEENDGRASGKPDLQQP